MFVVEILIALYSHDSFLRANVGDILVVILIYCFVKSFFDTPVIPTAISVLLFAYLIETLQYFKIVEVLGLQHSKAARIIIGTAFSWLDIIAYTVGVIMILVAERLMNGKK